MEPKYAENIIAGVIFKKKFQWYLTDKTIWKLDYRKLYDSYDALYRRRRKSKADFPLEKISSKAKGKKYGAAGANVPPA